MQQIYLHCPSPLVRPRHANSSQSPDLQSMEQIRRVMRPTDVPDTGELEQPLGSV